jgi:hypothetical protein
MYLFENLDRNQLQKSTWIHFKALKGLGIYMDSSNSLLLKTLFFHIFS